MADFNNIFENDIIEDDLEIFEIIDVGIPRQILERENYFYDMSDSEYFKRFRITKVTMVNLLLRIEGQLEHPFDRNFSLAPIQQTHLALRFYATGNHLLSLGDFIGVHISTASRVVKRVSEAIARLANEYIRLPNTDAEIFEEQQSFFAIAGFPRVIGAVDGTHIKIQSPGGNDAEVYRNRKQYFSLNVQCVCNAKGKITNIVARWPGSAHDATIFNTSNVRARFENGELGNSFLLGDSAYNLRPYLMTPLANPTTMAEQRYNESQIRTRGTVERMFGVWKRRFPVLAYGCRLKLETTMTVIVATAILHNIACEMGEDQPPNEDPNINNLIFNGEMEVGAIGNVNPNINEGQQVRQQLIQNYFENI